MANHERICKFKLKQPFLEVDDDGEVQDFGKVVKSASSSNDCASLGEIADDGVAVDGVAGAAGSKQNAVLSCQRGKHVPP